VTADSPSDRRRTPDRTERDGDTEQAILEAAHRVFLRHGTSGARMQDIAREADVNQALLHYYFRSKDRLAAAVFRRAAMELLPPLVALLADAALSLDEKITRVVHHELDQLSRTPYLPGYVLSELTHHPERCEQLIGVLTGLRVDAFAPTVLAVLDAQLRDAAREGRMRAIAPEDFLATLVSLCIFPFAARPMLSALFRWDADAWAEFVARRRRDLPGMIREALRP
jgi:AcrR family transcriptional regulator